MARSSEKIRRRRRRSSTRPRGVERGSREATPRDGDFSLECTGQTRFHGDTGLTRAANPNAAGFQMCMLDSVWKNSGWAAGAGNDGNPRREVGFQTSP